MQNGERLESKVEQIVQDLSSFSITNVEDAIKAAADIVEELPDDLSQCKNIAGDLYKIKDWADNIDLSSIPARVLQNLVTIASDTQDLVADW